jgi:PAS domain S-box-containing protein
VATVLLEIDGLSHSAIQQSLLGEALEHAPALAFLADREMRYVAVNRTACNRLGYEREELLSLRVTDIAVAPDASDAYQEMLSIGNHQGITPIRAKDGHTLQLAYNAWEVTIAREPYYLSIGVIV